MTNEITIIREFFARVYKPYIEMGNQQSLLWLGLVFGGLIFILASGKAVMDTCNRKLDRIAIWKIVL